jgi:hypothetical protein
MKLRYLVVLGAVFACANADAGTKNTRLGTALTGDASQHLGMTSLHSAADNPDPNLDSNIGFIPLMVAVQQIDAITNAIQGYIDRFHTLPPPTHQELFPALDGQNPDRYRFLFLEKFRRNAQGEVVDPWKQPYRVEKLGEQIIVASRQMHYVRAVNLLKHPVKSIKTPQPPKHHRRVSG